MSYAKTKSRSTMKGDWYEVKVAALLFLRSKNSARVSRFQLATNVEGAGALDDIVHRWMAPNSTTWHTTFVQLKHKERALLRLGSFAGPRGDFSLKRYLASFGEIKKARLTGDNLLLGGPLSCFQLVIYTNARAERNIVAKKSSVRPVETSMFEELLRSTAEDELIFKFNSEEVVSCLDEGGDDVREFLDKLTVFSGEPSEGQLDDVIKKELAIVCKGAVSDVGAIYRIFEGLFKRWWRDSDEILDENSDILCRAVEQLSSEAELTRETERCTLGLEFEEGAWEDFNMGLAEGACLLHVVATDAALRLTATKVLRLLYAEKLSFTFTTLRYLLQHRRDLLPDWRDGYKDCLVVVCDTPDPFNSLIDDLKQVISDDLNKKTIIVSRQDCQLDEHFKDNTKYKVLHDNFVLTDLNQSSRARVFGAQVLFQGHPLTFKDLYDSDVNFWTSMLSDNLMEALISQSSMTIGVNLPCVISHFIPRRLKKCGCLNKELLKCDDERTDVFAVSGETIQMAVNERIVELDAEKAVDEFHELCVAHSSVHWLRLEGGELHWVRSHGNISTIRQFVEEGSYVEVESERVVTGDENRVVLLIAEPGMGKSTLMSHLAETAKKARPLDWVVHINLRDHSELFNRSPQLGAIDFLTAALGIGSSFEESFLRASLEVTGNVVVLLDSFDEICPRYEVEGCGLLTSILGTRVRKAVVTSRHSMQRTLENHLSTLAYTIVEFTEEDQRVFFRKFWAQSSTPMTAEELENFIERLIERVDVIDPEKQLMQVPLQTMMLAEVFQDHVTDPLNHVLPQKLDMLNLFEQFIDKKFLIFFRKGFVNLSIGESKCAFIEDHQLAAVTLIVPDDEIEKIASKQNIVANATKFLADVERAKYNSGLVISVVNMKPVFLHRMFAEYFAATWFAGNYLSNRDLLRRFLFHPSHAVVRVMFDRILSTGSKLHQAILDKDMALLDALLKDERCDVDCRDRGGRSALHLAAALEFESTKIDSSYRVHECFVGPRRQQVVKHLLDHGAATNHVRDDVLQWTPLEYAFKANSWEAMECLLGNRADNTTLQLPLMTITDENMLEVVFSRGFVNLLNLLLDRGLPVNHSFHHKCLLHYAAQYGYLEVVELLLSRGADKRCLDYNDNVPLHVASRFGHLLVVRALIENTSRESLLSLLNPKNKTKWFDRYVNIVNKEGDSPLHFAMTANIVRLLVSRGADVRRRSAKKRTCLHAAARFGKLSVVETLVAIVRESGEDVVKFVNLCDALNISATCYAAIKGHAEVIRFLASHGADIWGGNARDRTCLHYVAASDEARALVESLGGDRALVKTYVDRRDKEGHTALALACIAGNEDKIRLLISYGADVWIPDLRGRTSLHYVLNGDAVRALIGSLGSDEVNRYVNTPDATGCSPLIVASRGGHSDAVSCLVEYGADVWARDVRGRTCLHIAAENGCLPVAEVLVASLDEAVIGRFVTARDANGLTARDVAILPCHMDRYEYYKDARVALASWLDEVLKDTS